jgi:transposase InsO family protein
VKLHANAKTTPKTRLLLVRRILEEGWDAASAAEAAGVSRRCGLKWLARYRAEGLAGLEDRPSAPHCIPNRTPDSKVRRIKDLRLGRMAAYQIARVLRMARSTVSAVLVRLGLNRLKVLEPKEPANRYEHARPGELLHVDTKKLARFKAIGHRIHGDRQHKSRANLGWEFAHVAIDDHSRVGYVEVLQDEKGPTAAGFLDRAVRWFAGLGVRVERVLSDNGGCYKNDFDATCEELGIRHLRTRPYRPRTNGKAERFIQTILREWAYARPYASSAWRRRALGPWLRYYNQVRPHGSLDANPPMTRILRSG